MKLRDYQLQCISDCLQQYSKGIKRQVVSLPVGSGKTVVFANLIKQLKSREPRAVKTLVLAHRTELLHQAYNQIKKYSPELDVAFDSSFRKADHKAQVVISSVQTLGRAGKQLLYDPCEFKCIIIDEAHHAAADSYLRVLDHFKAFDPESHLLVWGCSATVRRNDAKALSSVFQEITFKKSFHEMIKEKWLCNFVMHTVETQADLSRVKTFCNDFSTSSLSENINLPIRNELIVSTYQALIQTATIQNYKSTVVFAADINHLNDLVAAFRNKGIDARGIHSKQSSATRAENLNLFKSGKIPVLVNCSILTEGVDIPRIDSVLLARPTKSSILLEQMIGRGLRLWPGKQKCLIIDFVDNFKENTLVATVPTLLGLGPKFRFENNDAIQVIDSIKNVPDTLLVNLESLEQLNQEQNEIFLTEFKAPMNPNSLENDYSVLSKLTNLAWVRCSNSSLVLNLPDNQNSLVISKQQDQFRVFQVFPMIWLDPIYSVEEKSLYPTRSKLLFTESELETALNKADEWAMTSFKGWKQQLMLRNAKWRQKPCSEKQIALLSKIKTFNCATYDKELINEIEIKEKIVVKLTKGQAADLITRFKFGAIAKAKEAEKQRLKTQQLVEKIKKMHQNSL